MEGTSNDDKYSKRRKEKNGICPICNRYNTWISWCQSCDPQLLTQGWTSGNETIDELIKSTQLKATTYNDTSYLQWVPYDDLKDIEKIDKGGFATIYKATWKNGEKYIDPRTNERSIRDRVVVLKKLQNSKNISDDFLNEFKNHVDFHIQFNIIKIYGLTKDPKTGEYIFVMKYIKGGSLRNYLAQEFGNLKWKDKISMLVKIIEGLEQIHDKKIVHRDLHSGNILKDSYGTYISDLGLSIPTSKSSKSDNSIGVIPYMAPEVFCGKKPYTMASDIYSFGVLMSVISTGKEPFDDVAHDEHLVMKICEGKRPAFSINTPKDYIKLAYQCMDANPDKRPIARDIYNTINLWKNSFNNDTNSLKRYYKYSQEEIDGLKSIRQEFEKMDKIQFDASAIMTRGFHPNAIYTSRILNFDYLPEPVNSSRVTIINNTGDSRQIDCVISDFD